MFKYSDRSLNNLSQCHPKLRTLMEAVILGYDVTIICGHRNEKDQTDAYNAGNSKAKWGQSLHNTLPSRAVDMIPSPFLGWDDAEGFARMMGYVQGVADSMNLELKFGRDFASFVDAPHIELGRREI